MIRSRFRRPTSKAMSAVLCPRRARPDAKLALEVVFPTPPLPDVTTIIFATNSLLYKKSISGPSDVRHQRDVEPVPFQPHLRRTLRNAFRLAILEGTVETGYRNQLRFHAHGDDARSCMAAGARQRAAA